MSNKVFLNFYLDSKRYYIKRSWQPDTFEADSLGKIFDIFFD